MTNKIRFVMEELLPPFLRDTTFFRVMARGFVGNDRVERMAEFRRKAAFLTRDEYERLYRGLPRVHDQTDNSAECIKLVVQRCVGNSICDVGSGTGFLLNQVKRYAGRSFARLVGVDIALPRSSVDSDIEFVEAGAERLPFRDREFDTVLCTHVLEHILDYKAAVTELRRIAARRLIIVVPRERESIYTFNPHFNFFPYKHSFLRAMHPVPEAHVCLDVGRDIFYMEEVAQRA